MLDYKSTPKVNTFGIKNETGFMSLESLKNYSNFASPIKKAEIAQLVEH